MYKIILNIGISFLAGFIGSYGVYNYVPVSFFSNESSNFGSTITTIQGSDTLSSSRSVINNNFSTLNATKIENSTTSVNSITTLSNLSTVGTITSGTWQGTGIDVARQGTGSTSPSLNYVMLGNGASGFKVVTGLGSSGQFLTSNGAGSPPTWTSSILDTSLSFSWTGANRFSNLISSTTVSLSNGGAGYSLIFPSTQGASSTSLKNDGSGNLTWNTDDWQLLVSTTTTQDMVYASTTFPVRQHIKIIVMSTGQSAGGLPVMRFNNDGGANYGSRVAENNAAIANVRNSQINVYLQDATSAVNPMFLELDIMNSASTSTKKLGKLSGSIAGTGSNAPTTLEGAFVWNNTTSRISSVQFLANDNLAVTWNFGMTIKVYGSRD